MILYVRILQKKSVKGEISYVYMEYKEIDY